MIIHNTTLTPLPKTHEAKIKKAAISLMEKYSRVQQHEVMLNKTRKAMINVMTVPNGIEVVITHIK